MARKKTVPAATSSKASSLPPSSCAASAESQASAVAHRPSSRSAAVVQESGGPCSIEQLDDAVCKARELTKRSKQVFARPYDGSFVQLSIQGQMGTAIPRLDVAPP